MIAGRGLICGLALAGTVVFVQAPPASGQTASDQVRLVRMHVAALDAGGKPVDDLTADDFHVRDQNKDRRIVLFRRDGAPPAGPEYTNRVGPAARPATIILLDMLNPGRQAQLDAVKDLAKTLAQLKSGDSLFLYLLKVDGTLEPIHPVEDWSKAGWPQQVGSLLEKAGQQAGLPKPAGLTVEGRTKETYVALEALSSKLAAFPSPRQIVWLSYDIPNVLPSQAASDGDRASTDYKAPVGGIGAKAGLHEDAAGVPWVAGAGDTKCPSGIWVDCALYLPHMAVTLERNSTAVYVVNYAGTLDPGWARGNEQFAGVFGGRSYLEGDLGSALAQSAADAQGGYTLAYEQPAEGWDAKFHAVRLTCSRKDVNLLTRQRYYAVSDKRDAAAREQGALAAAFNTPSNVSNIGLRVSVTPNADHKSIRLQIRVDKDDLLLARHGDAYDGQVTISWVNYNDAGPVGAPGISRLPVHVPSAELGAVRKEGIALAQDVAIDSTIRFVRLFVVDRATCVAGSLMIPVAR